MQSIFVLGDSISCYYGRYLQQMLEGVLLYDRKGGKHKLDDLDDQTDGVNGGDSSNVWKYVNAIQARWERDRPDYLLLNCGLHDVKCTAEDSERQVPIDAYERNLNAICDTLESLGINVIWVRTTPVLDRPPGELPPGRPFVRFNADVIRYNSVADRVMIERGGPVIDLYSFTRNLGDGIYADAGVHFNEEVSARQAAFIAGALFVLCGTGTC